MLLTKQGGLIVKPLSTLFGWIFDFIYNLMDRIGVVNIGFTIILFTILVRIAIFPLMIKQNKSTKIMNYIQPEITKVTKKYKGKRDQESLLAQQRETKAIQDKYGVSLSSGCLTGLIQLPIFMATYRIIQNIPAYVTKIYNLYDRIATVIYTDDSAGKAFQTFYDAHKGESVFRGVGFDLANKNTIIDVLAKFSSSTWDSFTQAISGNQQLVQAVNETVPKINERYDFFGINLTTVPGFALTTALLIPIASLIFQFLSMHATPQQTNNADPTQQATMKSMKMMMNIMPLFSFFICVSVPAGLGLYWAVGSLVSFLSSIAINAYFKKADMDKILEKSKEKAEKKRAKRKNPEKKSFMERMQEAAYGPSEEQNPKKVHKDAAVASLKNYTSNTMKKQEEGVTYRAGSLAARANALQKFNGSDGGDK